jgi:hypothetical protein
LLPASACTSLSSFPEAFGAGHESEDVEAEPTAEGLCVAGQVSSALGVLALGVLAFGFSFVAEVSGLSIGWVACLSNSSLASLKARMRPESKQNRHD